MQPTKVLRIGIVLDGRAGPAWIGALVERVIQSKQIAISQVFFTGATRSSSSLFTVLYGAIDRLLFPLQNDALASTSLITLLADIPALEIRAPRDWTNAAAALAGLDVLLDLGSGPLPEIAALPCPLWHYSQSMRQGTAGLAEVVQRCAVSGAELFAKENGQTHCIYRSWSGTHNLSARRNRQRIYWKAHAFAARRLEQLAQVGAENFYQRFVVPSAHSSPLRADFWRYVAAFKWHWWRQALSDLFYRNTWHVHCGPCAEIPDTFDELSAVRPTANTYWADPFIVEREGERLLFVEEYDLKKKKGHIAVATLRANNSTPSATTIIDAPYHLSYPFVFTYENEFYMLPESSDNTSIDLYHSTDFPLHWQHAATLMRDVYAVDSTLFFYHNRWWLFTCIAAHSEAPARDELFLYYADSPLSATWTPHPLNPIVSDARCARPAGRIFTSADRIIRPAQDCSRRYGYGLRLMEIVTLDEEHYEEREYRAYLPQGKRVGIHTFNRQAGWAAIDVKFKTRRWP